MSCASVGIGKPAWNTGTKKCDTCANVNSNAPYWDGEKCVTACPETYDSDSVCQSCEVKFGDSHKQYWNGSECVSCYGNNPETPVWDTESKNCAACPEDKPNWNTKTEECKEKCPEDAPYWNGTDCLSCVTVDPTKPAWNAATNNCDTCANADPSKPYQNGVECVDSCPETSSEGVCKTCEELYGGIGKPLWNGKQCVSCFSNNISTPDWNSESKTCVPCPDDNPNWNTKTSECVEPCPAETPYWNGTKCILCHEESVETPIWNPTSKACEPCSGDQPNWNLLTKQCQSGCAEDRPHWNGVGCTPCASVGLKRGEDGACVASCDRWVRNESAQELECVSACPHWWYSNVDGFCRDDSWKRGVLGLGLVCLLVVVGVVVYFLAIAGLLKCKCKPKGAQQLPLVHDAAQEVLEGDEVEDEQVEMK